MPRWLRVIRGMIGTGLTFAAGVGSLTLLIGVVAMLVGTATLDDLRFVGRVSVVAFILGVAFSGVLALVAHGGRFNKLSLRLVGALGAGAGLLYWVFLAMTGGRTWSPRLAISNLVLLLLMGTGSAVATLLIARRAGAALKAGGASASIGAGDEEVVYRPSSTESKVKVGTKDRFP